MVNELFAKSVDEHTRNLILEKFGNNDWEELAAKLESFDAGMIGSTLPAVGSEISVKYKVDAEGDFVNTPWQVLGYNGSIPEYVKYKYGEQRIFVRSVEENQNSTNYQLLKSSFAGSPVYNRSADGIYSLVSGKTVASVGNTNFTYGTTNTTYGTTATTRGSYSVPTSITVDGIVYEFAGYNMTLAPKYLLPVKNNGVVLYHQQFDSGRGYYSMGQCDWSTSMSRSWLNDNWTAIQNRCAGQQWNDKANSNAQTRAIKGMIDRVQSGSRSFFAHVMPTVNRTWTGNYDGEYNFRYRRDKNGKIITSSSIGYDPTKANADGLKYLDSNQCEHCIDKFWLLGTGHANISGVQDADKYNDTCVFSNSFSSRIRYLMKEDGTGDTAALTWRLRSANATQYWYTTDSNDVCSVYKDHGGTAGFDDANITNNGALLPACTIC